MLETIYNRITPETFDRDYGHYLSRHAALELCLDGHHLDNWLYSPVKDQLKEIKTGYTPPLSLHGPRHGFDPASRDRAIRELAWRRTIFLFDVAAYMAPDLLVFHSSYNPLPYGNETEQWVDSTAAFWRRALKFLPDENVKVMIENIYDENPEPLAEMLRRVNHPRIGFCLDIGHFNLFSKNIGIEEYLAPFEGLPLHMHLHDNSGEKDEHLPPGQGTIDYAPLIACLKKRQLPWTLTAECKNPEANEKAVTWVHEHLGQCRHDCFAETV